MIQAILQKVLDNLNAPSPDLSYIRGMVEVLLAMQEKPLVTSGQLNVPIRPGSVTYAGPSNGVIVSDIKQDEGDFHCL